MSENAADKLSGRHPLNTGHLVMGLAFAGLVAVWAVLQTETVELSEARWLLPLPWIVAGAVGLVAASLASRRKPGSAAGRVGDDAATGTTETETPETPETTDDTEEIR